MIQEVRSYFDAEKFESTIFITAGIIAFITAFWFWFKVKDSLYTGIAFPLLIIALIQLVVGSSIYFRSPKDTTRVENYISNDKTKINEVEIPRMNTVMKNFVLYRYVEIILILAGLFLIFFFSGNEFVKGIGIGLNIQSALMLIFDFFAEKRGTEYLIYLKNLVKSIN